MDKSCLGLKSAWTTSPLDNCCDTARQDKSTDETENLKISGFGIDGGDDDDASEVSIFLGDTNIIGSTEGARVFKTS